MYGIRKISIRVPTDLLDQVDATCKRHGLTRQAFIEAAMLRELNPKPEQSNENTNLPPR